MERGREEGTEDWRDRVMEEGKGDRETQEPQGSRTICESVFGAGGGHVKIDRIDH